MLKVISLFSGAMGLDIGFEEAGFDIRACCEIDKHCCESIRRNRPSIRLFDEGVVGLDPLQVAKESGINPEESVLIGGPPCQSFSSGGNRSGLKDPRGNLIFEYFRFVRALRPQGFVMENVGNLLTAALQHRPIHLRPGKNWNLSSYSKGNASTEDGVSPLENDELSGSAFRYLLKEIMALGYSISFGVVNSADYGSPQKRIRFCMFGCRDYNITGLPPETHGKPPLKPYVNLRDAIGNLRNAPGDHSIYTERMAEFFELIPAGGNWRSLTEADQREVLGGSYAAGGGKTGFMRRLSWDSPSPTLTTKPNRKGTALCHPEFTRPLSVREYKRIQGFPDEWFLSGAMHSQYQQVGNAVPTHLGKAFANFLLASLENRENRVKQTMKDYEKMMNVAVIKMRSYARNNQGKFKHQLDLL